MDRQTFPWSRVAVAGVAVALLILAGVVWLGFAFERLRTEVMSVERAVRETPPPLPAPAVSTAGLEAEIKAVREAVGKLSARVEALRAAEDTKALERLTAEIKALSGRVDALGNARTPAAKAGKAEKAGAAEKKEKAPAARETPETDPRGVAPRPYYGPGYPGWPGY